MTPDRAGGALELDELDPGTIGGELVVDAIAGSVIAIPLQGQEARTSRWRR